jgi:hypothetical protein
LAERGWRRPRLCLAHTGPGGVGSPSVPTTWGCPFQGWTREGRAGRKPRARAGEESAVRPRKHGPEAQNRRGGAPKGDALSAESAPAGTRKVRKGLAGEGGGPQGAPFGALPPRFPGATLGGHGRTGDPAAIAAGNESPCLNTYKETTMTRILVRYLFLVYGAAVIPTGWQ